MSKKETQIVLDKFFRDLKRKSRKKLKEKGAIASKDLYKSMKSEVKVSANSLFASMSMQDYWKFVNYGVKGIKSGKSLKGFRYRSKKPPVNFLKTWLKQKTGRFRARDQKSIAYAIRESIYQKGVKPTEFFTEPFELLFRNLPNELIEAYGLDIDEFLEYITKDIDGDI